MGGGALTIGDGQLIVRVIYGVGMGGGESMVQVVLGAGIGGR